MMLQLFVLLLSTNLVGPAALTSRALAEQRAATAARESGDETRERPVAATEGSGTGELTAEEMGSLWGDLAGADAGKAYEAILKMTAAGKAAVAFLGKHLKPVAPVDAKRVEQLIRELDADSFEVRERATGELAKLGEQVEPDVRKVAENGSEEARKRANKVLEEVGGFLKPSETLRSVRALKVLEDVGSPEARAVLEELSRGAPGARVTREAKMALERLAKREQRP